MAQKAAKTTARRNSQVLNRTHLIALAIHTVYLFLRVLVFRRSYSRLSLLLYALLSGPAFAIEFFFERGSRPKYHAGTVGNELRTSGDDLDAKGLTEWMWDVLYWTWGCTVLAAAFGDWAWWAYSAIPAYSAWLAYSTFASGRRAMGDMGGAGAGGERQEVPGLKDASNGQQKLRKKGPQRVQFR